MIGRSSLLVLSVFGLGCALSLALYVSTSDDARGPHAASQERGPQGRRSDPVPDLTVVQEPAEGERSLAADPRPSVARVETLAEILRSEKVSLVELTPGRRAPQLACLTVAMHPDLAGAQNWVRLHPVPPSYQHYGEGAATRKDELGRFVFERILPGEYRVEAEVDLGPGKVLEFERQLSLLEAENAVIELGEPVQERVVLYGSVGVPGLEIALRPVASQERLTTTSSKWGKYELSAPGSGKYVLELRPEGGLGDVYPIELPNRPSHRYDIELPRTSLTVLVSDSSGSPMKGCSVVFDTEHSKKHMRGVSDGEGSLVRQYLRPGRYLVTASAEGRQTSVELDLEEWEQRTLRLWLAEPGSVHFENLGGVDSSRVGSWSVVYEPSDGRELRFLFFQGRKTPERHRLFAGTLSKDLPRMTFTGLPPGPYQIMGWVGEGDQRRVRHVATRITPGSSEETFLSEFGLGGGK